MGPPLEDIDTTDRRRDKTPTSSRRMLLQGGTLLGISALSGQSAALTANNRQMTKPTVNRTATSEGNGKLRTTRQVSLEMAKAILDAAEEKSRDIGLASVITVTDAEGSVIAQRRMDNAWLPSVNISRNKAYTAAGFEMPTHELADVTTPGESLWGLHATDQNRIVVFGGGFPLTADDEVVGAIGSSGGSVSQDMEVASAGVNKFDSLPSED